MNQKKFYSQLPREIIVLLLPKSIQEKIFKYQKTKIIAPDFKFSQNQIKDYENSIKRINFWHGTGKFKYHKDGVNDILTPILEKGIETHLDTYLSILSNDLIMNSISLTRSRQIARCYADIHIFEKSLNTSYRAGNSAFWLSKYYARMYFTTYTKYFFLCAIRVWGWRMRVKTNSKDSWSSKVNKKARTTWDAFHLLSDIEGNFPVVIGVSKLEEVAKLPKMFAQVEIRSLKNILVKDIRHIEVPINRVAQIKDILRHNNISHISVFPIEIGEYYLYKNLK